MPHTVNMDIDKKDAVSFWSMTQSRRSGLWDSPALIWTICFLICHLKIPQPNESTTLNR